MAKNVELMARDLKFLAMLFEYKTMDYEAATRFVYQNCSSRVARKRMNRLKEANFIKTNPMALGTKSKSTTFLTDLGLKKIVSTLGYFPSGMNLGSASIVHDLRLIEIGEKLRPSPEVVEYKTENVLQSLKKDDLSERYKGFQRNHSDAMITALIQDKEYFLAIEYEATAKSDERWRQKLYHYHIEDGVNAAIYICEDDQIKRRLEKIENELCQKYVPKLFTTTGKEFLQSIEIAIFKNVKGQTFKLKLQN